MHTRLATLWLGLAASIAGCDFDAGGYGLQLDAGADLEVIDGEGAGGPTDAAPGDPDVPDAAARDDDEPDAPDAGRSDPPEPDAPDAGRSDPPEPEACGAEGDACCAEGEACEDGTECAGGTCTSCGGLLESCCDPGAGCRGLQLCVAGTCV